MWGMRVSLSPIVDVCALLLSMKTRRIYWNPLMIRGDWLWSGEWQSGVLLAAINQSASRFIVNWPDVPLNDKLMSFSLVWLCLYGQSLCGVLPPACRSLAVHNTIQCTLANLWNKSPVLVVVGYFTRINCPLGFSVWRIMIIWLDAADCILIFGIRKSIRPTNDDVYGALIIAKPFDLKSLPCLFDEFRLSAAGRQPSN